MADLATLGFAVDSAPLARAAGAMQELIPAAKGAQTAVDGMVGAVNSAKGAADGLAGSTGRAGQSLGGQSAAVQRLAADYSRLSQVQRQINATTGVSGGLKVTDRGADIMAYGQQLDSVRAKFNPLFAAGQQYKSTLAEINQAYRTGAIGQKEYSDAIMNTKVAFTQQVNSLRGVTEQEAFFSRSATRAGAASKEMAAGVGLARYELINLSRQAQDVGVSLVSGQSPLLVLAQQGSQIADVFASSEGTVKGFFGQVASGAARILTPMRLAAAGVVGIGAGAAYAGVSWVNAQSDIERSLIGIGARTGTTVATINKFARDNASITGLSVDQARNVAIEFTKTGDIAVGKIKGLGEAVRGFSILTGQDATDAAKSLAQALSGDLVDGARELNKTYGFLNPAIEKSIQNFMKQGDRAGAAQVIVDAMAKDNLAATGSTGLLTKAWDGLGNAISRTKNFVGEGVFNVATFHSGDVFGGRERRESNAQADAFGKQDNRIQTVGMDAAKSVVPQIDQLRKLEQALSDVQRAKTGVGATGPIKVIDDQGAEQILKNTIAATKEGIAEGARYGKQVAAISQSWGDVGQKTALALDAAQTQLPVIEAVGGAAKIAAQYGADYAAVMKQGGRDTEAAALAASNMRSALAQVNTQARETLFSLQNQIPVSAAVTGAEQMTAQAIAIANQLRHDGVDATIAQEVATAQIEVAQTRVNSQIESQISGLNQQTELTRARANGSEAAVAAAQAYTNAIKAGASETAAAALQAAVLANNLSKAGGSARSFSTSMSGGGDYANLGQFGNQEVGLPGTSGTDLQQAMWKTTYGAGGYNTFINGGFGINGGRFDVNAMPNDQGLQYMHAQTLKAAAEKNMDSVTRAKFEAGSYKLPQSQAQAIADAFLAQNNNSSNVNAQKAASDFVGSADSSSSTSNSLINPMYTSGSSNVIAFRAASGMDYTVPGTGPVDSVRVSGLVSPGERLIAIPPGGAPPKDMQSSATKARANINQRIVIQAASMRGASDTMSQLAARAARAAAAAARHR